jgi:hypothetical protein
MGQGALWGTVTLPTVHFAVSSDSTLEPWKGKELVAEFHMYWWEVPLCIVEDRAEA